MSANWGAMPGELIDEDDPDAIDGGVTEAMACPPARAMDEFEREVHGSMVVVVYVLLAAVIGLIVAAVAGVGVMVAP